MTEIEVVDSATARRIASVADMDETAVDAARPRSDVHSEAARPAAAR
jgi:hypothetical protein